MAAHKKQQVATLVGANITRLRRKKGWSQKVLAEKLGIGADSVSRFENGFVAPRLERLQTIADILECDLAELFLRNGYILKMDEVFAKGGAHMDPRDEMVAHAERIIAIGKLYCGLR